MRTLLHRLFSEKEVWGFQKANLQETKKELKNPRRGWYRIFPFLVEKEPDFEPMSWCEIEKDTMALVIINIGAYREKELDEPALENMRTILRFFVKKQYDIILRITYDHEGKALEREPFFFTMVKEHVRQVVPVIREFSEHIFVYQGLLVGSWGEMHTSRFVDSVKLKELWQILKTEDLEDVFFAVRKPSFWRMLHPHNEQDRMGLFDDAIFGSQDHLGTFGSLPKEERTWDELWRKQDELAFEEVLCTQVPNGGEVVCGEQYTQTENAFSTVETLKKMHITYLNRQYDERILNTWKQWKWEEPGLWQGSSLYDYIGNHLGYRFRVRDVMVSAEGKGEKMLLVTLTIENVGFANLYQEAELLLTWMGEDGKKYTKKLECDLRRLDSGQAQVISGWITPMQCELHLCARGKKDGRILYLANQSTQDGRVLLGSITRTVK